MIRVGLVSPRLVFRTGLRGLLGEFSSFQKEEQEAIHVVAEAASLYDLGRLPGDIDILLVTDDAFENFHFEQIRSMLSETAPVVLLVEDSPTAQALYQQSMNVWGVLPLEFSPEELVAALRAVGQGLVVLSPSVLQGSWGSVPEHLAKAPFLFEQNLLDETNPVETLTMREKEVLQLLAQGLANKQIAVSLEISEHTVKFHVSSIYAKLGVANRTEAVRRGIQHGLILL
jgi:DNA-binding NarL/FixJ family response regulator